MTRSRSLQGALRLGGVLLFAAALAGAAVRPAQAGWPIDGVPAGTGSISQYFPAVCSDGAGGAFIVFRQWASGQPEALRAQRVDASGNVLWAAGGVVVAPSTGDQRVPMLLSMGDGGAMIAWEDNRSGNYDIYVQRLTGSGTVAAGWPAGGVALANSSNHETDPVLATDGAGGAFLAWGMWYSLTDVDIYAGHISGSGVIDPAWPLYGQAVAFSSAWQDYPAVAADQTGGFYIAWRDSNQATQQSDVYAAHLASNGQFVAGWNPNGNLICAATGRQGVPSLTADGWGGFIAAWRDFRSDAQGDIWAMRMNPDASEVWTHNGVPVCTAANAQGDNWRVPIVSAAGLGAIVAWQDNRDALGTGFDIYAQWVDPMGYPCWPANGVPMCIAPGLQGGVDMCSDEAGGAYLVWGDQRAGRDVYAQHVVSDGRIVWPLAGLTYCTAAGNQTWPVICSDQNGGALVVWQDGRGADDDIYVGDRSGRTNLVANDTHTGWDAPAVPRNLPGATAGDVHVTPVLDGNLNTTWLNYHTWCSGSTPLPTFQTSCTVDGIIGWVSVFLDGWLPAYSMNLDSPPITITGGRHTVELVADEENTIPETLENDNAWMGQWVWSPLSLVDETPLQRLLPADWGDLGLPNVDGMVFTRAHPNMAWVVSAAPRQADTDCDLYVFDDYAGSTSGFSHFIGGSSLGLTHTDFVVGHYTSAPTVVYPGVLTYGTNRAGSYAIDAAEAIEHQGLAPPKDWTGVPMLPNRLADVYELYLTGGATHWVSVARDAGTSTLELGLYPATGGGIFARATAVAVSTPATATVAQLYYTAPASGWYPLVVYRTDGETAGAPVRYSLHWATHPLVDVPDEPVVAGVLSFEGARPNPMHGSTALAFSLSRSGPVRIEIFDARGRLVRVLANEAMEAGAHRLPWDGRTDAGALAASGIHWVRLTAEGRSLVRKVALLR